MDLINREQALGCFWNYANDDGTGYDETEMPAYDRLQALPIVAEVEDCVSRQAATQTVLEFIVEYLGDAFDEDLQKKLMERMNTLPAAQPQRIKGHWIEIASSNHTYKCSVCGRLLVNITDGKNNVAKNYPYCHCGADMRGGEDDDNGTD